MQYPIGEISSYNISGKPLPSKVETKILLCHVRPLKALESVLGFPLYVSIKSGYRSKEWEKEHGRSGYSQHTYEYLGAVDLTFDDFNTNKDKVIEALSLNTEYTRIAIYNSFLHIDYKNSQSDRWLYDSNWKRLNKLINK